MRTLIESLLVNLVLTEFMLLCASNKCYITFTTWKPSESDKFIRAQPLMAWTVVEPSTSS